jgi:L-threonylcarbamoyladenylate synthase
MKYVKLKNGVISGEELTLVMEYLQKDKVVVLPTDTIYGLHCLAKSKRGVEKIKQIKRRPKGFGFVHLMKSYCMVHEYCQVTKKQDAYLRNYWPRTTRELQSNDIFFKKRPVTFILNSQIKTFGQSIEKNGTIAVRLPKYEILIKILKKVNQPLLSSSLNISGKKHIDKPENIKKSLYPYLPDLVIDKGVCKKHKSSVLIDITNINNPKILRN